MPEERKCLSLERPPSAAATLEEAPGRSQQNPRPRIEALVGELAVERQTAERALLLASPAEAPPVRLRLLAAESLSSPLPPSISGASRFPRRSPLDRSSPSFPPPSLKNGERAPRCEGRQKKGFCSFPFRKSLLQRQLQSRRQESPPRTPSPLPRVVCLKRPLRRRQSGKAWERESEFRGWKEGPSLPEEAVAASAGLKRGD